jgi:ABC-type bacteriocin/lantibiotic exporter with double-glycine peptidase domain
MMFQIIKQTIADGCIPACAASVMRYHKISGDWNEPFIYKMYKSQHQLSGFDTLKLFLENNGLPSDWNTKIVGKPINFKQFLVEKNALNIPVLCPINQGPGNNAHCVVIAESDEKNLVIYDPHPSMQDKHTESYEGFQPNWAGSFFWFEKNDGEKNNEP